MKKKLLIFTICYLLIGVYSFITAKIGDASLLERIITFFYLTFLWPLVIIIYFIAHLF